MKTCQQKEIVDVSSKLKSLLTKFKRKGTSAFKEMNENEQRALINWSKVVTRQYTNLIDNELSNVKDIADLPYAKEDIKLAIKIMLPILISNGPQSMIKRLKLAYQELGSFQQIDNGDCKKTTKPTSSRITKASRKREKKPGNHNHCLEITISERKILFQEIKSYVDGLKYRIRKEN
jgi:hypothetical protein